MTPSGLIAVIVMNYVMISIVWFLLALRRKNKPDKWYDYILCWPALGIAAVIGLVNWIIDSFKK